MKKVLLALIMAAFAAANLAYAEDPPTIVWDETWDSGFLDYTGGVAFDAVNDAVYLTGTSRDGSDMTTDDIVTLKYDTDGNFQWAKVFDSDTTDCAFDVAVDGSGFIYVGGYSKTTSHNRIRLIKYDADSAEIWNVLHVSPMAEVAYGVTTDATGNIYVAGPSWGQARTVKFASNGDEVWANVVEGFSGSPKDLVVAPNGSIYVAGVASEATKDPLLIRYNSYGDTIWHKHYDLGAEEYINGVAVDDDGYLYLAGSTKADQDSARAILVAKLDADGNLLWNKTFDYGQDDAGLCITLDQNNVFVSGSSYNETSYVTSLPLLCYDKDGTLLWDTLLVSGASGRGIVSDGNGNLYISTRKSPGDFGLIKVNYGTGLEERPVQQSCASLEVLHAVGSSVTLRYSLPHGQHGTLTFYSTDGRKVESYTLDPAQSVFTWSTRNTPSGVYFARLDAENGSITQKLLIVK